MKKSTLLLVAFSLTLGFIAQSEAIAIKIGSPQIIFTPRQPIQAVIVDSNGNASEQTFYYNPDIDGVDIDASMAGPDASIYFPSLGTGYIWYNGYWVDQDGYYWNGQARIFINHPHWKERWTGYWDAHSHGGHAHWRPNAGQVRIQNQRPGQNLRDKLREREVQHRDIERRDNQHNPRERDHR